MTGFHIETHFEAHQQLVQESFHKLKNTVEQVAKALITALKNDGKIIAFGNGGSAVQASHFAGELLGKFNITRRPLSVA